MLPLFFLAKDKIGRIRVYARLYMNKSKPQKPRDMTHLVARQKEVTNHKTGKTYIQRFYCKSDENSATESVAESRTAKLKRIAKTTRLITGIAPLVPTRTNIKQALNQLRELSRSGKLKCKCLDNRRVVVNYMSINHHYFKAGQIRRAQNIIETRGTLIPYISTILNKTGVVAENDIKRKGSYGIVGRAMVGGNETAIKIVLQEDKKYGLLYLSVFDIACLNKNRETTSVNNIYKSRGQEITPILSPCLNIRYYR